MVRVYLGAFGTGLPVVGFELIIGASRGSVD